MRPYLAKYVNEMPIFAGYFWHPADFAMTRGLLVISIVKIAQKFPGLATSGRHNSAMITDRRKFTAKLTIYGISSFNFYR